MTSLGGPAVLAFITLAIGGYLLVIRRWGTAAKVAELAKTCNKPGHKIRVRDEAGGIVMLIGVVALRHSSNAVSAGVLGVSGAISEVR